MQASAPNNFRLSGVRMVLAAGTATTVAAMLTVAIWEWVLPPAGKEMFFEQLAYCARLTFLGIAAPLTWLHFRQRKSGREPFLAYVCGGALGLAIAYFVMWTIHPYPIRGIELRAIGLALIVGGGVGGAMYRFAVRAAWWRTAVTFAVVLAVTFWRLVRPASNRGEW
ncbi:MAG: hypothetical protein ABIZ49_09815 [Opitutaceae bacterium]